MHQFFFLCIFPHTSILTYFHQCGTYSYSSSVGNRAEKVAMQLLRHNRDRALLFSINRKRILISRNIAINGDICAKNGDGETRTQPLSEHDNSSVALLYQSPAVFVPPGSTVRV